MSAQRQVVLNQYRTGSNYKDVVGVTHHFPKRYLKALTPLPVQFIYYEPRTGGRQVYFGTGVVASVDDDTEEPGHCYADITCYQEFVHHVSHFRLGGGTWEASKMMRNSVRIINADLFAALMHAASVEAPVAESSWTGRSLHVARLEQTLGELVLRPTDGAALQKIRRVYEAYERPSSITNAVKRSRGAKCQLCGQPGFLKRDGKPYCEVHHLFHLAKNPPLNALSPECVVVVCATCHRRMHYADVGAPEMIAGGWVVRIDGDDVMFQTHS